MLVTDPMTPEQGGPAQPPAPTAPRLVIEMTSPSSCNISVAWSPGADLDPFDTLLCNLCTGKLAASIGAAIAIHASRTGDGQKGTDIVRHLQEAVYAPQGGPQGAHADDPLVCPTQVVRLNLRPFQ